MTNNQPTPEREATAFSDCTCANLRKAARMVTQAYDAALQSTGLKSTQFILLANLAEQGDMPLTQLADALVMDRTTLTRNLKPLVRQGLVHVAQEADLRVRRISLTRAGRAAVVAARPKWEAMQLRVSERLGDARWAGLLDDLNATVEVFREG